MTLTDLSSQRLYHHGLSNPIYTTPQAVVSWLGAVQSQDYAGAKWGVSQRIAGGGDDALVEAAFNRGEIVRTHVLRPTWHFVAPADVRWMLMLTAPRVHALNAHMYRQCGLNDAIFAQSRDVLVRLLEGGKQRTRTEIAEAWQQAGIETQGAFRLVYLLMHAELEGLICSGARQGKHHTYALLEEWVAPAPALSREEALAALVTRYFTSHAPATIKDFVRWSGLTVADAKAGLASTFLQSETIEGELYWYNSVAPQVVHKEPFVHLLPNYDEYEYYFGTNDPRNGNDPFFNAIFVNGKAEGIWRRILKSKKVIIESQWFTPPSGAVTAAFHQAVERYGAFVGLAVEVAPLRVKESSEK